MCEKDIRELSTYPRVERILDDGRVALGGEHEDAQDDDEDGEDGIERLSVREVAEVTTLGFPRHTEAEGDDTDGTPYEEGGYACKVEEPREDDALAPDGGEEGEARDGEGEQQRGDRNTATVAQAEHAGSLACACERE